MRDTPAQRESRASARVNRRLPIGCLLIACSLLVLDTEACHAQVVTDQPAPSASSNANSRPEPVWSADQRAHWAFQPIRRGSPPTPRQASWAKNPIDAFTLQAIEEFGIQPAPAAEKIVLIRRVCLDLTGLPPTPEQLEAFLDDNQPQAYERLVESLLASPAYGEKWARMWLDLARYAESDGFKSDKTRPWAYRYRDWVVRSLNDDMPYDRFLRLQLAGDELEPSNPDAFIATGFNRNWPFEDNNKVPGLNRQLMLDDMTDTTAAVVLGLTVGCARCHDHKYDPISQRDYYRLQAFFAASAPRDDYPLAPPLEVAFVQAWQAERDAVESMIATALAAVEHPHLRALLKEQIATMPREVRQAFETDPRKRTDKQADAVEANLKKMKYSAEDLAARMSSEDRKLWSDLGRMRKSLEAQKRRGLPLAGGMTDEPGDVPAVRMFFKGNFQKPGEVVEPGLLSIFVPTGRIPEAMIAIERRSNGESTTSGRRAALAEWVTRSDHPLTSRVIVNRLWQHHFGRGIVATPSDFGTQANEPTHPELLDWLASELVRQDWSLKAMHRLMVLSSTYRQSSGTDAGMLAADPENTLFARMVRRRVDAEEFRDAMLAVAGRLDRRIGGVSVFPDLPPGIQTRGGWNRSQSAADRERRSLYVFARRNLKYPLFDVFDSPDTNVTCPERHVTVTAPQALMLMNSPLVLDAATSFAHRALTDANNSSEARASAASVLDRVHRIALGRPQSGGQRAAALEFLRLGASEAEQAGSARLIEPDALADYCHVLLNLNEFVFVD